MGSWVDYLEHSTRIGDVDLPDGFTVGRPPDDTGRDSVIYHEGRFVAVIVPVIGGAIAVPRSSNKARLFPTVEEAVVTMCSIYKLGVIP